MVDLEVFEKYAVAYSPQTDLRAPNIYLVSSTFYNTFVRILRDGLGVSRVNRVIFDEGDSINIAQCEQLSANYALDIVSKPPQLGLPDGVLQSPRGTTGPTDTGQWNDQVWLDQERIPKTRRTSA